MFLANFLAKSDSARSGGKHSRLAPESSVDSTSSGTASALSRRRSRSPTDPLSSATTSGTLYISDESQLRPVEPLPRNVADLNENLEVLATLFPDVQIEVFREMLTSFSEESRIEIVTDLLLRNPGAFVKGRRRAASSANNPPPPPADGESNRNQHGIPEARQNEGLGEAERDPEQNSPVPRNEAFRDAGYKEAVRHLALQEFKGLSKSSIEAVLSETNYSYLAARPTLVELSSKSWKFAISSMLFRRKPVATSDEAAHHPLVVWRSTGAGSIVPAVRATGSPELDRELFAALVAPLRHRERTAREEGDRALAFELHTEEAEACDATYECGCCFTEATFEEFTTCNGGLIGDGEGEDPPECHMVCFRCVQHSIREAVFGQGWRRTIDPETGTLRCPAVCPGADGCGGRIPEDHMRRAMMEEKKGFEILHQLDQRLAEHGLAASGLPLVRCPFCHYAEVDELYLPPGPAGRLRLRAGNVPNLLLTIIGVLLLPLCLLVPVALGISSLLYCAPWLRARVAGHARAALDRHRRRRRGLRFVCRDPGCGRASCLSCGKAWADVHVCHESSLVALRTQVEQAMSAAVKRVCPRCATSFVKTAGCNKLTCPCGYRMCYVCRADLGADGYRHFCQHFRPEGDGSRCPDPDCGRCNLWESEDVDAVLRQARQDAEARWREAEARDLSDAEKAYLENASLGGVAAGDDGSPGTDGGGGGGGRSRKRAPHRRLFPNGRMPTMAEFCDMVMEALFV